MRATKITIRTRALRAGHIVNGVWEPAGQLIATLWIPEHPSALPAAIAAKLTGTLDGEEVVATVEGREDIPSE